MRSSDPAAVAGTRTTADSGRTDVTVKSPDLGALRAGLSGRELQVVLMTVRGLTAQQVGERLFIGRRTVETHLASAYAKLGIRSKHELVALAYDTGSALPSGSPEG